MLFITLWLGLSAWLMVDCVLNPVLYNIAVNSLVLFVWNLILLPAGVASLLSLSLIKAQDKGNYAITERRYAATLKKLPAVFKANKKVATTNYCNLATARLYNGNFEGADQCYSKALEIASADPKFQKTPFMGMLYNNFAVCLMHQNRLQEAEVLAQNAVDLVKSKSAEKWGAAQGLPHTTLAGILLLQNRLDETKEQLDEAQKYYVGDPGWSMLRVSQVLYWSLLKARQGELDSSLTYFKELLELRDAAPASMTTLSIMPLYLLANEYMNSKQYRAAEQALQTAYTVAKQHPVHPVSIKLRSFCEKFLLLTERKDEINDMHSWLWDPAEVPALTTEGGKK